MGFLDTMREEVQAVRERDPAAQSAFIVALTYPGLHALWGHRLAHRLWHQGWGGAARTLSQVLRLVTGVEIHPAATIGRRFFIDHGMGVVIGETAEIGDDVTVYHGVTLGGTSLAKGKRHPTLGDRVVVGTGAAVLGDIHIGDDCRIGANAVVVKSVPANSVVVGIPGQAILRSKRHDASDPPDFQHALMPDMIGTSLVALLARVEHLEAQSVKPPPHLPTPDQNGIWHGEDFSI